MKRYYALPDATENFITDKPLNIVNCGYNAPDNENIHYKRTRPDYYLIFLSSGCGVHMLGGKRYKLKEGDMFLYSPDEQQEYSYRFKDKPYWYWVHFNGFDAANIMKKLGLASGPIYPENTEKIFKLYNRIIREYKERSPFYEDAAVAILQQLLIETSRAQSSPSRIKDLSQVVETMTLTPSVSNDECAKMCNLSTVHFIRLFKSIYNTTPHKFKQQVIIEQAKELLLTTNKTVTYISEVLGFENNPLYFNKLFKSVTGLTATEFRAKHKLD